MISPRQGRSENFTNIHTAMVGYTLNHGGIFTQPWWTIHTQPWWDIHSTMVGHTLEDKAHINLQNYGRFHP